MSPLPISAKCVKYLLFLFNLLFVITGIILLSVGATVHGLYSDWQHFIDQGYLSTSAFLIAIGLIIFIIAFFGCCGAVKENFCMVITFSTLLILVFIFELSAAISGYVLRDQAETSVQNILLDKMKHYNETKENQKLFDILQTQFECCGVNSWTDWPNSLGLNDTVPVSCCGPQYGALNMTYCNSSVPEFYNQSCSMKFGGFLKDHAYTLGGVAMAIAIIQLMGIVFSCYLSKAIKKNYENV